MKVDAQMMKLKAILIHVFLSLALLTSLSHSQHMSSLPLATPSGELRPPFSQTINLATSNNETLLSHVMEVDIQIDFTVKVTSTFVLANNNSYPISNFLLTINMTIFSVFCSDPLGPLDFQWMVAPEFGNLINISMRFPLLSNNIYVFSVTYVIDHIIYHNEGSLDYYGLDFEVTHPRNTETFVLDLSLPVYATIVKDAPFEPIFPSANKIYKENEVVTVEWQLDQRIANETDIFLVRFAFGVENTGNNFPYNALFYPLTVLFSLLVGGAIVFLVLHFRNKPVEKELVTALLTNTEQEIIKAINADGGISTQRRICEKTGYSKSKVSQILTKLEEKKVLKRERWGRTNKVTITNSSMRQLGMLESK